MFKRFLFLSVGVLALLWVTANPATLYAQHRGGGFRGGGFSPRMGTTHPGMMHPGMMHPGMRMTRPGFGTMNRAFSTTHRGFGRTFPADRNVRFGAGSFGAFFNPLNFGLNSGRFTPNFRQNFLPDNGGLGAGFDFRLFPPGFQTLGR
jgi:hypothetical protein